MLVVLIGGLPGPALADEFCEQLKAIVADASSGFSQFRGAQTKQDDRSNYFSAKGWPVGAVACEIKENIKASSKGRVYPNYKCEFPANGNNKGSATLELAKRVAACLRLAIDREDLDQLNEEGGQFLMNSDSGVGFQIISGPMMPTISFAAQSRRR